MAGAGRRRHRPRRLRPLAVHAELKGRDTGDFGAAWGGIASLQLGLPAVWTGGPRARRTASPTWSAGWPRRPRGLVGLAGARAGSRSAPTPTSCVFAPDEAFAVDPARLHHRNPVTPYAGRTLAGVVRGDLAARRPGRPTAGPRGRLLRRGRADDATTCPSGGLPPQTDADHRPGGLHRGVRRASRAARCATSSPAGCRTGTTPGSGCSPGRCPASPRPSASTSSRSRPAAAPTGPRTTRRPRRCCSSSTARRALTLDGAAHALEPGCYAFLPPGATGRCATTADGTATFHWIRKAYERVDGLDVPRGVRDPRATTSRRARCPAPTAPGRRPGSSTSTTCATTCTSTSSTSSPAARSRSRRRT